VSQENVEVVRRGLAILRESYTDDAAIEGLLDLCAPDVRVDASRRIFNPDIYDGAAGVRRAIQEIRDAWEDFCEDNQSVVDAGDRVLVVQTISARGRTSRAYVEQKGALIWTLRDGRVELIEVFVDPREALKAVGRE